MSVSCEALVVPVAALAWLTEAQADVLLTRRSGEGGHHVMVLAGRGPFLHPLSLTHEQGETASTVAIRVRNER
jgi:hypothetical protein